MLGDPVVQVPGFPGTFETVVTAFRAFAQTPVIGRPSESRMIALAGDGEAGIAESRLEVPPFSRIRAQVIGAS